MNYSFDGEIAKIYGVNEAIFIQHIYWWIDRNRKSGKNFHRTIITRPSGGMEELEAYWTYNSMQTFTEYFPFWTHRQIRTIIYSCRKKEAVYVAQFNEKKYDKTLWYTLNPRVAEMSKGSDKKVQPIPDIKPVINNYKYPSDIYNYLVEEKVLNKPKKEKKVFNSDSEPYLLAKFLEQNIAANNPKFPQSEQQRQRWAKDFDLMIRIDKIEADDISAVIDWCQKDKFWCSNILSGKKLREKYQQLSMKMVSDRR